MVTAGAYARVHMLPQSPPGHVYSTFSQPPAVAPQAARLNVLHRQLARSTPAGAIVCGTQVRTAFHDGHHISPRATGVLRGNVPHAPHGGRIDTAVPRQVYSWLLPPV